jgi:hypothetical protein
VTLPAPASFDVRLAPGRAAFNRGDFFAAHELWEMVWRELGDAVDGGDAGHAGDTVDPRDAVSDRLLVQGLIQIAAGLHHAQHGRTRPAARLLARGASKLTRDTRASTTLPIAALVEDVGRFRAALEAPGGSPDPAAIRF